MNMQEQELTCEEKLEAAEERILELEEALRLSNLFRTAKDLHNRQVWLPVTSLLEIFHESYQIRNQALANNKSNIRLIFSVSNEGRIIGVQEEEPV